MLISRGILFMFCSHCGAQLADGSQFCAQCGAQLATASTPTTEAPVYQAPAPTPVPTKKNKKVLLIVGIVALALILTITVIAVVSKVGGKSRLERMLLEDWSRVETSDDIYYTLVLDFEEGYVDYLFESAYVNDLITSLEYEVISDDQIMVPDHGDRIYTITFSDDKTMMTITPALTSTDSVEYWFNFD